MDNNGMSNHQNQWFTVNSSSIQIHLNLKYNLLKKKYNLYNILSFLLHLN